MFKQLAEGRFRFGYQHKKRLLFLDLPNLDIAGGRSEIGNSRLSCSTVVRFGAGRFSNWMFRVHAHQTWS